MNSDVPEIIVQIVSSGSADAALPREKEKIISADSNRDARLRWLPPVVTKPIGSAGLAVESTVILFVSGMVFGSLIKPFFEAVAQEAGKDFWSAIKRVIARIRKAQSNQVYSVQGHAYVIFELGEESVALDIPLPVLRDQKATNEAIESYINEYLGALGRSWDEIKENLSEWNLGRNRTFTQSGAMFQPSQKNTIHVISKRGETFYVVPVPAEDVLQGRRY